MLPTDFGAELTVDLAGMESLLGGLADFSLAERSRTLTLLLTVDVALPLKNKQRKEDTQNVLMSQMHLSSRNNIVQERKSARIVCDSIHKSILLEYIAIGVHGITVTDPYTNPYFHRYF